ncbi:hypothetical protein DITRI_Ditri05aG0066900 [Diplodiscus trichospermus]
MRTNAIQAWFKLSVMDLVKLQKQLDIALFVKRARKTQLMMECITTLQEKICDIVVFENKEMTLVELNKRLQGRNCIKKKEKL